MLNVENIHTYYGLSHILFGISFDVGKGEIVSLLGRNGAGKSTTMRSIMGLTPPREGAITFHGKALKGKKPHQIARMGVGYVPDTRRVFADLTVGENLDIVARKTEGKMDWDKAQVYTVFSALKAIDGRKAGYLSGGEQQMLAIARALMINPTFLLLDEPTEGLAPIIVETLSEQIRHLRDSGVTVLLAEQNVKMAMRLSDRAYVIDDGVIRYHGTVAELQANDEVRKKYLLV